MNLSSLKWRDLLSPGFIISHGGAILLAVVGWCAVNKPGWGNATCIMALVAFVLNYLSTVIARKDGSNAAVAAMSSGDNAKPSGGT